MSLCKRCGRDLELGKKWARENLSWAAPPDVVENLVHFRLGRSDVPCLELGDWQKNQIDSVCEVLSENLKRTLDEMGLSE